MSVLRIFTSPVVRDHYGRLWNQSQHPLGYMLMLLVVPLFIAILVGQFLTIDWGAVQFLAVIFGLIFAFSFRAPFQIPNSDEADSERAAAALEQLRQSSMYAVFVSFVALVLSAIIGGAYIIARQNPDLLSRVQSTISADGLSLLIMIGSIAILFVSIHYILTVFVVFRWLYLGFKTGLM